MPKKRATKKIEALTEREDLEFALQGFRDIARQSAANLATKGLVQSGSQGREKINPNAKIFRDAVKTIESLRKRLRALEQEEKNTGKSGSGSKEDLSFLDE
jgi:phage terminase small subunit